MKKHLIIFFVCLWATMAGMAQFQPMASSASSPLWYYIQEANEDGNAKVMTCGVLYVEMAAKITDVNDEGLDAQLWRFEGNADEGYTIENKASGRQMDVFYFGGKKKTVFVMKSTSTTKFVCVADSVGLKIASTTVPNGGSAASLYIGVDGAETLGTTAENATRFTLDVYNDSELLMSDEVKTYWYRIVSAKAGMGNYAVTDNLNNTPEFSLPLLETDLSATNSMWKITKDDNDNMVFTNRATQRVIACASVENDDFNATQVTPEIAGQAFKSEFVGNSAYMLSSMENDSVYRYLTLAQEGVYTVGFPTQDINSSEVAWCFKLVETELTGVDDIEKTVVKVSHERGRIYVSGCNEWHLYNVSGMELPRTTALPSGIYIVKTPTEAIKVNIK